MIDDRAPVIVGVGQAVERIDAADYVGLSAADLAAKAARAALADCGAAVVVDAIAAVRTFDDSLPLVPPFGVPDRFPLAVARRLGIAPDYAALGSVGGETPVALIGAMGARIAAGESSVALIVAGEAISTVRHLQKIGETREWAEHDAGPVDDAGARLEEIVKPWQLIHGLRSAPAVYGLIETARRGGLRMSKAAYAQAMGELMAPFTQVAAANPYASAAMTPLSAEALVEVGAANRMVADPYPLRLVARDQVNQGAAVLLMSVAKARASGIDEGRWVYVEALATGAERDVIERPDLGAAPAAKAVVDAALAGRSLEDVAHFDFYSCFPVAVSAVAIDALGLAADDLRGLTVTGGLPFFGGAGNGYALHGVVEIVRRVRGGGAGLVFALGGYLSKFAAVVLSEEAADWPGVAKVAGGPGVHVDWHPAGAGRILGATVLYANGHPVRAVVIGELASGARFVANEADAETLGHVVGGDPVGAAVVVSAASDGNVFRLG